MPAARTYITADTHFGHEEAIELFDRPFPNAAAMDDAYVEAINAAVGPRDRLIHLGDFTGPIRPRRRLVEHAAEIRARIRCRRVELVAGNHDPIDRREFRKLFSRVDELRSWKDDQGLRIVLCHYPLRTWQGRLKGAVHLFGHAHGALADEGRSGDVGVDVRGIAPIELERLVSEFSARSIGV